MTVEDLQSAGYHLASLGLCTAQSGNLSVRRGNLVTITASGSVLGDLDETDLSVVSLGGELRAGRAPSKELPLHLSLYRRDVRCRAIVHLHSPHAVAISCVAPWSPGSAIPPLTPYFVMRVGPVPMIPYAYPGADQLAELIDRTPGNFRALLLQNHGPVVAHESLGMAVEAAIELEAAAQLSLLVGDRGTPLGEDQIAELVDVFDARW